ncbi:LAME_0G15170g1_1 [Lachancea meyersii CBS 8951]|uniref:LAME_0G15170g1_1 n=1 Tax=Lachancea meyersii CBS 8951 TaxID=1266667 RepID=A0A1G4KAQ9_9SACH|nr:LAME_0G15170g1_1 [Lachancea meyersii CBS 8951]
MNSPTDQSPPPASRASKSSSPNVGSSGDGSFKRARRTMTSNVDYNLKKRRIIPADDSTSRRYQKNNAEKAKCNLSLSPSQEPDEPKSVIVHEPDGKISFNEPKSFDPINGMTGLPLGMGPPEKVKKECYWVYKKNGGVGTNGTASSASSAGSSQTTLSQEISAYENRLETRKSEEITQPSFLRTSTKPKDIYRTKRQYRKRSDNTQHRSKHLPIHTKIKASTNKEGKLFGQNSITNQKAIAPSVFSSTSAAVENDDLCSSCHQPGVFLCCDTCPKSFHFACCNPPLDPDNLPEGDWSCPECQFKMRCPNKSAAHKLEKEYLDASGATLGLSLFGKLLFKLEFTNPRQFLPAASIRDAFAEVKTGTHGEYSDGSMREPLNEKQAMNSGYGQSLTKMDQYNPEQHVDPDSGELLICYKCRKTKMGTIDHPEEERLITKCDVCGTPWHLDCIPDIPRASFKTLGSKWICPLHADSLIPKKRRRLARHQKFYTPASTFNVPNNGDIEILLDEISSPLSKETVNETKTNKDLAVLRVPENSIKLNFIDKVYKAKAAMMDKQFQEQEKLIDKALASMSKTGLAKSKLGSFLYFTLQNNRPLQKMWDFKELCDVATKRKQVSELQDAEVSELLALRGILESKSKKEVMAFFGMKE